MTDDQAAPLVGAGPSRPGPADPRLDQAEMLLVSELDGLVARSGSEQVDQLEQVHALLAGALASVPRG